MTPGDLSAQPGCIIHWQGKLIRGRERERERGQEKPLSRLDCPAVGLPGQAARSSQALFSTAASGHKVQWGDFVISSQGSLKGPALLPEANDYLLGHQQTQMSVCVGLGRRWGLRGGPGQG